MRVFVLLLIALLASACATAPTVTPAPPTFPTSGVELPANYRDQYDHYATVERTDGTIRDLYVNPGAIGLIMKGQNDFGLPEYTVIVIEAYNAQLDTHGKPLEDATGRYIKATPLAMIHVAEKRPNWQEADFPSIARAGDWNFGSYDFQTHQPYSEGLTPCFNCHNAQAGGDFIYSVSALFSYAYSREVQYQRCDLPGRIACS